MAVATLNLGAGSLMVNTNELTLGGSRGKSTESADSYQSAHCTVHDVLIYDEALSKTSMETIYGPVHPPMSMPTPREGGEFIDIGLVRTAKQLRGKWYPLGATRPTLVMRSHHDG